MNRERPPSLAYDDGTPYATDIVVIKDGKKKLIVTKRKEKLNNKRLNYNLSEFEKKEIKAAAGETNE